jgi:hypothetical protein
MPKSVVGSLFDSDDDVQDVKDVSASFALLMLQVMLFHDMALGSNGFNGSNLTYVNFMFVVVCTLTNGASPHRY